MCIRNTYRRVWVIPIQYYTCIWVIPIQYFTRVTCMGFWMNSLLSMIIYNQASFIKLRKACNDSFLLIVMLSVASMVCVTYLEGFHYSNSHVEN